jgi:superfamily I DNA/RNA helicase
MLPLYATRIADLGQGDFVKVDCAACHHVALLTPEALLRAGLSRADIYETERQLLYVSCTRARERLLVTGMAHGSEFLKDL